MSIRSIVVMVSAMAAAVAGVSLWQTPDLRARAAAVIQAALNGQTEKADSAKHKNDDGHGQHGNDDHAGGAIKLTRQQIEGAGITVVPVKSSIIARRITVPGAVIPDADRLARVAAKVAGTIADLHKRLGDPVSSGELLGAVDSREVADAKSQYLAAVLTNDLQQTIFDRDKMLWEKRISSEQAHLRARAAAEETRIKLDVARQKLFALGIDAAAIEALPQENAAKLRRHELRAPIAGRVVDRRVNPGSPVQPETEVFVIADLSKVWIEMAVPPAEMPEVKEGQAVTIVNGSDEKSGHGKVIFISPLLDNETRSARVVAEVDNSSGRWRPGTFVTAAITVEEMNADLTVPRAALQNIAGEQVVFVRTKDGFEKREIVLGEGDDRAVEVVFGLDPGERIAAGNSFVLKAELGKADADHGHAH